MLTYAPGQTLVHQLDPRTKLLVQVGFAVAAFAYTTPMGLAVLTILSLLILRAAAIDLIKVLWEYRFVFPFLVLAPIFGALTFGPPWIHPLEAVTPALASYRVVLVLLVSTTYVRTTSVRESQAAIQWLVPGRVGRIVSLGIGFVFRFLPLLRQDLLAIREAIQARLGDERRLTERMQLLTTTGLNRAFARSDRLTLALQARCLSWNPTMPAIQFSRLDVAPFLLGLSLLLASVVPLLP
jgi:biotin transport system permease protein